MVKKSEMTLEELEDTTNENRRIVIQNIKMMGLDIKKYRIYEYNDFPGGIKLIDKKERSIVVYYNYLINEIEIIFEDLKKSQLHTYIYVVTFLVDEYIKRAKAYNIDKKIVVEGDKDRIRYLIKSYNNNIIEYSKEFHIVDELYDAYDYIKKEINKLNN